MLSINPTVTATSSLILRTGMVVAAEQRCAAATPSIQGTGLSFATYEGHPSVPAVDRIRPFAIGTGAPMGALGVDDVMATVQVQVKGIAVLDPAATGLGDPPRRTPPRC